VVGIAAGSRTRILLLVLSIVSLVALFTTRVSRKMPDFDVYWTAGSRALAAAPLYREEDGHFQFKYLPAFAIVVSPIALVREPTAKALWFSASAVLMLVLLVLSLQAVPRLRRPAAVLLVLTFLAMAKFYAHEMVLGQVNLLFAALVALAVVWMRRGREAGAGLVLALTVAVKPYAIIFMPWLATRRRKLAFVAMAAGIVVILVVPAVRYGWWGNWHLHHDWWRTVTVTTVPNLTNQDNVSIAALFTKWLGPDSAAAPLTLLASCLLAAIAFAAIAVRRTLPPTAIPDTLEASLLLLLIPLLSPQGWDYVFLIGTPAVMLIINDLGALPRGLRVTTTAAIAVVALSIYDIMGRAAYSTFMRMSVITICVIVEFAALAALRFRRVD
jgi:glycosyl transferase family 87